jgi:hypothetical protein
MSGGGGPRRRGPASRLPAHRAVLALGLLAAGPPLILHDGWRGAIPAAGAAGYAVYLIAGKRWPLPRRRSRPPGKAVPQPTRPATAGSPVESTAVESTAVESTAVEGSAVESRAVEAPATERPVADGPGVDGPGGGARGGQPAGRSRTEGGRTPRSGPA